MRVPADTFLAKLPISLQICRIGYVLWCLLLEQNHHIWFYMYGVIV